MGFWSSDNNDDENIEDELEDEGEEISQPQPAIHHNNLGSWTFYDNGACYNISITKDWLDLGGNNAYPGSSNSKPNKNNFGNRSKKR